MAQATACGPDLESVSTGGSPRRAVPSRPLPSGVVFASAPCGTAAYGASMMMQPLSLGNADVTGADGERPGNCRPFCFSGLCGRRRSPERRLTNR